jgi:hypothetical protein
MKSTTFAAALMASAAVAQPHGHHGHQQLHAKRDLIVEWETVWVTATVLINDVGTQTVLPPAASTPSGQAGNFFEGPGKGDRPRPSPSAIESPSTYEAVPPVPTTPTTVVAPPQPTYETEPVVAPPPPTTAAPPVDTYTPPPPPPVVSYPAEPPPTESPPTESPPSDGPPSGGENAGEITYYNVGMGSCGYDDTGADDNDNIVAIPANYWDSISTATNLGVNMPAHPLCDKTITIVAANGNTAQAKIRDKCPGCSGMTIDVTPHAFRELYGSLDGGREECTWYLNEPL